MLEKDQIAALKADLEQSKKDIEWQFKTNDHFNLKSNLNRETSIELSAYDNHPGDEGTELFEREKDIALNDHLEYQFGNIKKAIQAIENGTYGLCEVCGKEIPIERLEAIPQTTFCIEHTPDRTISDDRPVEEEVLRPPFGRFDLDEREENVVLDAEDTWQEVAAFGNSSSPSDFYDVPEDQDALFNEHNENIGYVEDYENFIGNDIEGKNITVYPHNKQHNDYEQQLDEEGIMTKFGDLPAYEHDPYVEKEDDYS
ncbi:hypothetical protein CVD25_10355 [Bacillus canaveralius]|uniref:Zinc finger DksA/TraR C4-type domain-containing protein n=1 Tax=Bacillus canaveralius TaxID=1403243 RepID=A0A2N5GMA0_9BACI|nr:TraR/DksA C4-type zinc finger protein [Bacillus canaveralius]PLR82965.1 hypothetical protein CU635_10845 [Bacillus canaveralius]PLR97031.1 hypothetical protein CVD25_10355 [Bacillus canaveralius]